MVHTDRGYVAQKGFINRLRVYSNLYDKEFSESFQPPLSDDECITPVTPFKKRILYKVIEFDELLDSSNLTLEHQKQIALMIQEHYYSYDAFVVLHGTDTVAYTASSLSFMLENLNKPVILTGSQIPILELKTDAVDNLLGALLIAGQYQIPEVAVFFGNKLLRGNRTTKISTSKIVAFESPNLGPLGEVGVNFSINWSRLLRHNFDGKLRVFTRFSENISLINIMPCMNLSVVENILQASKAVIVQAYGMGNIPSQNRKLVGILRQAIENDVIIVIMTQCREGGVNDLYETGRALVELGAVLAYDMTLECVLAKLAYLLGKGYSDEKTK
jgi:60kDa lysophospholipase